MDPFAIWLQEELAQRGWSRSEAARRGGITPAAIDRIVNGLGSPGLDLCRALARAFNMPLESVLRRAGILSTGETSGDEAELVAYYRALPDYDRRTLLRISKELYTTDQARRRAAEE